MKRFSFEKSKTHRTCILGVTFGLVLMTVVVNVHYVHAQSSSMPII